MDKGVIMTMDFNRVQASDVSPRQKRTAQLLSIPSASLLALVLCAAPVLASQQYPAKVNTLKGVPSKSPLNIRKSAVKGIVQGAAAHNSTIMLNGECKRFTATGMPVAGTSFYVVNNLGGTKAQRQVKMGKPGVWCEVGHEPTPNVFKIGWVRGAYVKL
jgi:hypothetical protein